MVNSPPFAECEDVEFFDCFECNSIRTGLWICISCLEINCSPFECKICTIPTKDTVCFIGGKTQISKFKPHLKVYTKQNSPPPSEHVSLSLSLALPRSYSTPGRSLSLMCRKYFEHNASLFVTVSVSLSQLIHLQFEFQFNSSVRYHINTFPFIYYTLGG